MHEQPVHSTSAITVLSEILNKNRADRERHAKMLSDMGKAHLKVRGERDKALSEVERLTKILEQVKAENARLTKRERELSQEVSMMAAAIDVANRELSATETMLLDTAVAVNADFTMEAEGIAAAQPPLPSVAIEPESLLGFATPPKVQPKATVAPVAPAQSVEKKAATAVATGESVQKDAAVSNADAVTTNLPAAETDVLDQTFSDIEKMLSDSLGNLTD